MSPCAEADPTVLFGDGGDDPSPPTSQISITNANAKPDGAGGYVCEFLVTVDPIKYTGNITASYATSNDSAIAGVHYTAASGTVTVLSGKASAKISVVILKPNVVGHFDFKMTLSSPTGGTIIDALGYGFCDFDFSGDPADLVSFTSWPNDKKIVYNEYAQCYTGGACGGYSGATAMSALWWTAHRDRLRFDGKELFTGSGGTLCTGCKNGCTQWYVDQILNRLRSVGVNICSNIDGGSGGYDCSAPAGPRKGISYTSTIQESSQKEYVKSIKRAVARNGAVLVASSWYSNWWNLPRNAHGQAYVPIHTGTEDWGHIWTVIGWNNNIPGVGGAWLVQNCFGKGWGNGGRAWMPFSQWSFAKLHTADGYPRASFHSMKL